MLAYLKSFADLAAGIRAALADKRAHTLLLLTSALISLASAFYAWVEGWSLLDAVYFSVTTIATVGLGDLAPRTDAGKIFTIFYIILGIGLFVAFAGTFADSVISRANDRDRTPGKKD